MEEKQRIIALHNIGYNLSEISREMGLTVSILFCARIILSEYKNLNSY